MYRVPRGLLARIYLQYACIGLCPTQCLGVCSAMGPGDKPRDDSGFAASHSFHQEGFRAMIPIAPLQRTAEELMAKAAFEIPEDYLAWLRRCADTEKGDLSAFVI